MLTTPRSAWTPYSFTFDAFMRSFLWYFYHASICMFLELVNYTPIITSWNFLHVLPELIFTLNVILVLKIERMQHTSFFDKMIVDIVWFLRFCCSSCFKVFVYFSKLGKVQCFYQPFFTIKLDILTTQSISLNYC